MRQRSGPQALWFVRHGQSQGNVIRDAAETALAERFELEGRDADVPLSPLGEEQATAFGRWLGRRPTAELPTAVLVSPYLRARQTAKLAVTAASPTLDGATWDVDERLRDREMGEWDGLTWRGVLARHPEESKRAVLVGRYFHRPPGGESWADMVLRLRSVLADVAQQMPEERVLVVAHDVVIQLFRSVLDGLDEAATIQLVRDNPYGNAAVTCYERRPDGYELTAYNVTPEAHGDGAPSTEEPDVPAGR